MNACAIIPTYNNPRTLREVVLAVRQHVSDIVVVDDGSGEEAKAVARGLFDQGLCTVVWRPQNGGKGAAVKSGLTWAQAQGFAYALQIDADLQHDAGDIPALLAAAQPGDNILVLAQPVFDASAPRSRLIARKISKFWVAVETLSRAIGDPLCGFRVYPVALAAGLNMKANAMDFDPEIAVRLVWAGARVRHVPTKVVYVPAERGGVSHFRGFVDTALISWAHTRLCLEGLARLATWPLRRLWRACRRGQA